MFHVEHSRSIRVIRTTTPRRRTILGPVALVFSILVVIAIYHLAKQRQRRHGPVPPERKWWAEIQRQQREWDRTHGHHHHRRRY